MRLSRTPTAFVDGVRCASCSPICSRTRNSTTRDKQQVMARYLELSDRATGPQSDRRAGRHAPDLAGVGISVFPHARARCAGADRRAVAGRHGADHRRGAPARTAAGAIKRAYNSIYVIDHDGSILSVYDKVHLVPFGEYLPFQDLLEKLGLCSSPRCRAASSPASGAAPWTCRARRDAAADLLRVDLPGRGACRAASGPGWMLNLTNDGWFGISTGPYQHFQQARVRAIDKAAAGARRQHRHLRGGRSARRVIGSLPLGTEGVLDAPLPQPIEADPLCPSGEPRCVNHRCSLLILVAAGRSALTFIEYEQ